MVAHSRRLAGVGVLVVVIGIVGTAGVVSSHYVRSPAQVLADTGPPSPSVLTATVREGRVAEAASSIGTVSWGSLISVPAGADAAETTELPLVTSLGPRPGTVVRPGQLLLAVADQPVFALSGQVPMLRDLSSGMTGPDVTRFQLALAQAGYPDTDRPGYFGPSTEGALERLYDAAGFSVPTVAVVPTTPAPTPRGKGAVTPPSQSLPTAERSAFATVPRLPATLVRYDVAMGQSAASASSLAELSPDPPSVKVDLTTSVAAGLRVGDTVALVRDGVRTGSGRVGSIGKPKASESGGFLVPVAVTSHTFDASDVGRRFEVRFHNASTTPKGPVVPLSALYGSADGSTHVDVWSGQTRRSVRVTVVETGGGAALVAVDSSRSTLHAGDQVVVGSGSEDR